MGLLKNYSSGKLPMAFKVLPFSIDWEKLLELTKPNEWTPHAMFAATRVFISSMDSYNARYFLEKYLLPAVREDIKNHRKLNYHYYLALKKAMYKPAAWFKGILFPLCQQNLTLREATIIASTLMRISVPVVHSSIAIIKLCEMPFTGPMLLFLKVVLEKKYSLASRVLTSIVNFFLGFASETRPLPLLWHQTFLTFARIYTVSLDELQKDNLKQLAKSKKHHLVTKEILKALNEGKETQSLNASFIGTGSGMILE
eukprot:TRINITY_DN559_c0_g3_i2.p1 TRINITY_DN559_c0_g3~~TRINITY_DN559_c0_g3_i2.p1  ORF type:complete len:256 (-),score=60.38 TRINITY_DN559_c0_g3_i2:142-909(-)